MNLRIIAGKYGSRVIDAPDRRSTHAMGERIRNAIFNSLGSTIHGADVLDAFAGSGSVGIEAISRGATSAVFIEKDRIAAKVIQNNIDMLKVESAKVIKSTVSNWLETSEDRYFDVIFADPPYHDPQLATVARLVSRLNDKGTMIISLPADASLPDIPGTDIQSVREYGNAKIVVLRKLITK